MRGSIAGSCGPRMVGHCCTFRFGVPVVLVPTCETSLRRELTAVTVLASFVRVSLRGVGSPLGDMNRISGIRGSWNLSAPNCRIRCRS